MTRDYFETYIWNYYLHLERKLIEIFRYIECDTHNFQTYSIELSALFLSIGGELDSVFKLLCDFNQKENKNMKEYRTILKEYFIDLEDYKVIVRKKFSIYPFNNFYNKSPKWWRDYNKVKHGRFENYQYATLENVINILAALYILDNLCVKRMVTRFVSNGSDIFGVVGWKEPCIITGIVYTKDL